MRKALGLILIMGLALTLLVACNGDDSDDMTGANGMTRVKIEIENYGDVIVELDRDAAPITVDNFLMLVNEGFYDGVVFHRIIEDFMIQGGDPTGTGMGGSEENIQGEFASNGINNPISHERGVISMARQGHDPNSASSQFFIVHQDSTFLDGDYAAFGRVVEGMDVVDRIATTVPAEPGSGAVDPANHPRMTRVSVVD